MTGRSPADSAAGNSAVSLLAGVVTDPNEELPTSKRGRQASEVIPEYAATFAALINGEIRALIWPPKGTDADAEAVKLLATQATKYFKDESNARGKRPSYATAAVGKDGKRSRVCLTVVSKN